MATTVWQAVVLASFLAAPALLPNLARAGPGISSFANLVVDDVLFAVSPRAGEVLSFTAQVNNTGGQPSGNFTVRFLLDGAFFADRPVANATPGEVVNVTSPGWIASEGNHTIHVLADALGEVPESDETDNQRTESFAVGPAGQADLAPVSLTTSPAHPRAGDTVTLTVLVRNLGGAAAGNSTVRFRVDGAKLGDRALPPVPPGGQAQVTSIPWTAREGPHVLAAVADALDAVPEADETNNELQVPLTVDHAPPAPGPDLLPLNATFQPANPAAGSPVTFTVQVRNAGDLPAGAFSVRFLVDNATVGDARVPGLAAGEAANATSSEWRGPEGNHTLRVVVDVFGDVAESDEENNVLDRAFAVGPDARLLPIVPRICVLGSCL